MSKPLLIIMTRWPAPNRCKSRLTQDIGASRAAAIQKKLTTHTIAVANSLKNQGSLDIHLAVAGIGYKKVRRWANSFGIHRAGCQGKGNLGLKMKRQLIFAQRESFSNLQKDRDIIMIGTDVPDLCKNDLTSAIDYLLSNEIVIGPARDGGYWLIGFSKKILSPLISWPFVGIDWGSNSVLRETLKKIQLIGLNYKLLNKKSDLDQSPDLDLWNQ